MYGVSTSTLTLNLTDVQMCVMSQIDLLFDQNYSKFHAILPGYLIKFHFMLPGSSVTVIIDVMLLFDINPLPASLTLMSQLELFQLSSFFNVNLDKTTLLQWPKITIDGNY